jgi:hypothetical protein
VSGEVAEHPALDRVLEPERSLRGERGRFMEEHGSVSILRGYAGEQNEEEPRDQRPSMRQPTGHEYGSITP